MIFLYLFVLFIKLYKFTDIILYPKMAKHIENELLKIY